MTWTPSIELRQQALMIEKASKVTSKYRVRAIEYTIKHDLPYPVEKAKSRAS